MPIIADMTPDTLSTPDTDLEALLFEELKCTSNHRLGSGCIEPCSVTARYTARTVCTGKDFLWCDARYRQHVAAIDNKIASSGLRYSGKCDECHQPVATDRVVRAL